MPTLKNLMGHSTFYDSGDLRVSDGTVETWVIIPCGAFLRQCPRAFLCTCSHPICERLELFLLDVEGSILVPLIVNGPVRLEVSALSIKVFDNLILQNHRDFDRCSGPFILSSELSPRHRLVLWPKSEGLNSPLRGGSILWLRPEGLNSPLRDGSVLWPGP